MKHQKKSKDRVVSRREGKMHWEHIEICDQCIFPSQRRQHAGFVLFMMLHGEIFGLAFANTQCLFRTKAMSVTGINAINPVK